MVLPRVLDRVLAMAIGCLALAPPAPVVASAPGGGLPAAAQPPRSPARAPASAPAPVTAAEPGPASAPRFGEEIAVRLVTVVVRVVDGAGDPVLGLTPADLRVRGGRREGPVGGGGAAGGPPVVGRPPADLRVRVGRREVPVAAVDWVSAGATAAGPVEPAGPAKPAETAATAETAGGAGPAV